MTGEQRTAIAPRFFDDTTITRRPNRSFVWLKNVQQPVISVVGSRQVSAVVGRAGRVFDGGIFCVNPHHVVGAVFKFEIHFASRFEVHKISLARLSEAKSVIHEVLSRFHPMIRSRFEKIPNLTHNVVASLVSVGQLD